MREGRGARVDVGSGFARLALRVTVTLGRIHAAVLYRISTRRTHGDIRIGVVTPTYPGFCIDRVGASLDLIQERDASSYSRVRRYFKRLVIVESQRHDVRWVPGSGYCLMSKDLIMNSPSSTATVAAALVGESMRVHLTALGVPGRDMNRARGKVLCAMAKRSFIDRLSGEEDLKERYMAEVKTWASLGDRGAEAASDRALWTHLRSNGVPSWMVNWMERSLARARAEGQG